MAVVVASRADFLTHGIVVTGRAAEVTEPAEVAIH
jgi:hypothetical protein